MSNEQNVSNTSDTWQQIILRNVKNVFFLCCALVMYYIFSENVDALYLFVIFVISATQETSSHTHFDYDTNRYIDIIIFIIIVSNCLMFICATEKKTSRSSFRRVPLPNIDMSS